jgi:UPF0755 protein
VPRRSFRAALIVVLATFVLLGGGAVLAGLEVLRYPDRANAGTGREVEVEIRRGMKFPEIAEALAAEGLVARPTWFRLYATHRGMANQVRAGRYTLRDDLTPRDLLDSLVRGVREVEVAVTIREGLNFLEVLDEIAAAEIVDAAGRAELGRLARDPAFLKELGIPAENVEGYLFPDTYRFRKPTPPRAVLEALIRRHRAVWDELLAEHKGTLGPLRERLGWGPHEVVIMASIVEKEAVVDEERRTIASVFYNRLLSPTFPSRRLETDPTIRYGCIVPPVKSKACQAWDPAGRLRRAQLDDRDNLYNTYQHAGLPPGPIGNPGRRSIAAAMNPETTDYFFFVARDARTHVFSRTFAEHNRMVDKYIRKR